MTGNSTIILGSIFYTYISICNGLQKRIVQSFTGNLTKCVHWGLEIGVKCHLSEGFLIIFVDAHYSLKTIVVDKHWSIVLALEKLMTYP